MPSTARAPILVAPAAFKGTLRAPEVAAALTRGLEAGGWPIDPCPVADGGVGTIEVLLPALAGETAAVEVGGRAVGIGLIEDGGTAIVELCSVLGPEAASSAPAGELLLAAAETGAEVLLVGAGDVAPADGGAAAVAAITRGGGLRASVVVLCDARPGIARERGGIEAALESGCGGRLEAGAPFVLGALDFEERMRAARAVIVGEGRLDLGTLAGNACGEIATRARQGGIPCFATVGSRTLDAFGARILDLQAAIEARDPAELEAAGRRLATLV